MAMRPPRLHRGVVVAHGFHFDDGHLPEPERRRRILAVCDGEARVFRTPHGFLVRRGVPLEVRCDGAPGYPLVQVRGALSAVVDPPAGALAVLARGGAVVALTADELTPFDVSEWLDVRDWETVAVRSLGTPPPPPAVAVDPAPVVELARPPASERQAAVTAPWEERSEAAAEGMVKWLRDRITGLGRPSPGDPDDALLAALFAMARQHLPHPRLADVAARQHAQYLRSLLDRLRRGDVDEALRHAIPVDDPRDTRPAFPLEGLLAPRDERVIRPRRPMSLRSLGVPSRVLDEMRTEYRRLFARLLEEGRIDDACFVLAELLHDVEGAVEVLERHGRGRLAAELAEARHLPPGLVVRLWFREGDSARALRIARRTGAFSDAVRRLEGTDHEAADALRAQWAATLAASGEFEAAVRAGWPLAELHRNGDIAAWMERVIEDGGPPGARMLVQVLSAPDTGEAMSARCLGAAHALLEDEREVVQAAREALVEALVSLPVPAPRAARLARAAVRTVACEQVRGRFPLDRRAFDRLVAAACDPALEADLPPWAETPAPSLLVRTRVAEIVLDATGTVPVLDAAVLPDGRLLVALGEAGVRLLRADGTVVAHLDVPAHRLVIADAGNRAIAIGLRGRVHRLSRLDLHARRAERWCEATLQAWADDYDGSQWFAVHCGADDDGTMVAIDALAPGFEALVRIGHTAARVASVARAGGTCAFVLAADMPLTLWCGRYTLTAGLEGKDLETRVPTPLWFPNAGIAASPDGGVALLATEPSPRDGVYGRVALKSRTSDRWNEVFLRGPADIGRVLGATRGQAARWNPDDYGGGAPWPAEEGPPPLPWTGEAWEPRVVASHDFVAGTLRVAGGIVCPLVNRTLGGEALRVYLRGARQAAVRLTRRHLVVCDGLGRVAAVDVRNGRLTHQVTVSF